KTPDVLLSDIRMPGMGGLALLKQIKQRHPMLPVIIMTAHSDLFSVEHNSEFILIHTAAGYGRAVARILDYHALPEILGVVAGSS
ncbi:response regulator, partial [Salmonella enterica subsp. enterica serovar Kentucky]|nr:response regulator [Salmonella enterica subsp. enterica serovar Kentucky]